MAAEMDASLTATLLEEVDPVIRGAIRRKLRVTLRASDSREQNMDGLDLLGEVQLKLLAKLRQGGDVVRLRSLRLMRLRWLITVARIICGRSIRSGLV